MDINVFINGRTINRVEEVMTDLLLCELVGVELDFVKAIAARFGLADGLSVRSVCRSVHESALGETDIQIVLEQHGSRLALLIENKIRAVRMQRQFERYRLRGQEGVEKGLWHGFKVILAAPQNYIVGLSTEETGFLDGTLPYEWIVAWLRGGEPSRHAFKAYVFDEAIRDARVGYQKKKDTRMTAFHQGVHRIASTEYPELRMAWLEQAGYDDSIIHLPDALPVRGDKLLLKAKMGKAEMRIASHDPVATERVLSELVPPEWKTTTARSYAGVEVAVSRIDPSKDFADNEPAVRKYLQALRELKVFYHRDDVAHAIFASRGSR